MGKVGNGELDGGGSRGRPRGKVNRQVLPGGDWVVWRRLMAGEVEGGMEGWCGPFQAGSRSFGTRREAEVWLREHAGWLCEKLGVEEVGFVVAKVVGVGVLRERKEVGVEWTPSVEEVSEE